MSYRLNDPGYALFTQDAYYARTAYYIDPAIYEDEPSSVYTQGPTPPTRRDLSQMLNFDEEDSVIVIREINSTRLPTPEEMEKYLGYTKCGSENCHEEIAEIRSQFEKFKPEVIAQTSIPRVEPSPVIATASSNAHATQPTALLASARSQPGSGYNSQPLETTAASRKRDS
ncbi:hypothetical protein ACHAO1_008721 [Botrytis cinerea]